MATTHRISGPLVSALEATWASIVRRHPEVPKAVVVVASGTDGRKTTDARWGHFAALRWIKGETQFPEVLVAGEGLVRGAGSSAAGTAGSGRGTSSASLSTS